MESERQAQLLMNEHTSRYFRPFLARSLTVTEAAREVGCSPSVMLYRVGTLLAAGLLRVAEERPRAGRALKLYRSVHDAYFVPFSLTPFATLEELFYSLYEEGARKAARGMAQRFRQQQWDGYRLYRNANGEAWLEGAPDASRHVGLTDPDRRVATDFQLELHLSEAEAEALQSELFAYLQRYQHRWTAGDREGTAPYHFMVAFTPLAPADDE